MDRKTIVTGLLFLIALPASFATVRDAFCQNLTISGCAISHVGYLTDIVKEFEKQTGSRVFVRGGGSILGLEDLGSGKVDVAASCRIGAPDDPPGIKYIQVAWDALAFMVHKTNPIDSITLEQVRGIYSGKITNWKQLKGKDEPIVLFAVRPSKSLSGLEVSLMEMVLKGKRIVVTPNTVIHSSAAIVEQSVAATPNGFGTSGFSSARKRDLKMLNVEGVSPTKGNIKSGKYALKRPLFLVLPRNPKPEARKFVDFVVGKQGQKLISSYGMVSLEDMK